MSNEATRSAKRRSMAKEADRRLLQSRFCIIAEKIHRTFVTEKCDRFYMCQEGVAEVLHVLLTAGESCIGSFALFLFSRVFARASACLCQIGELA